MDSKIQGELAELLFQSECLKHKVVVAKPYGDSTAYDFIVDNGKQLLKVQVKSTNIKDGSNYRIMACKGSAIKTNYTEAEVDLFAFYIAPENVWYIMPTSLVKGKKITFGNKTEPFKNNWDYITGL